MKILRNVGAAIFNVLGWILSYVALGAAKAQVSCAKIADKILPTAMLFVVLVGCTHENVRPDPPLCVPVTEFVPVKVDPLLLQPTQEPELKGDTNGDLALYRDELKDALDRCNIDKKAISERQTP